MLVLRWKSGPSGCPGTLCKGCHGTGQLQGRVIPCDGPRRRGILSDDLLHVSRILADAMAGTTFPDPNPMPPPEPAIPPVKEPPDEPPRMPRSPAIDPDDPTERNRI